MVELFTFGLWMLTCFIAIINYFVFNGERFYFEMTTLLVCGSCLVMFFIGGDFVYAFFAIVYLYLFSWFEFSRWKK